MTKNIIQDALAGIGLTKKQIAVYLALLRYGSARIGELEHATGLHKQIIYIELERLRAQGLISESVKNKRKQFRALDPEVLLRQQEDRRSAIEQALPKMHAMMGYEQGAEEVNVFEGIKSCQSFHIAKIKVTPPNTTVRVLGAGGYKFLQVMEPNNAFALYDIIRERKNVSQQLLMHEKLRGEESKRYTHGRYKTVVKYLQDEVVNTFAIGIWFDSVSLLFFLENPKVVEIRGVQVAQAYTHYFGYLWKQART